MSPTVSAAPDAAELMGLYEALKTWGRWGDDDERGALNHLTPAHRAHAATLVRTGEVVSLAHDLSVRPTPENPFPVHHHMLAAGDARDSNGLPGYEAARDYVGCHVHGLGVTHVDALCHMFVQGQMYNGVPASEVRSDGARHNTIMSMSDGVVGRGVLLDIARLRGVEHIAAADVIRVDELVAAEDAAGLTVGTGDLVLVASGRDRLRAGQGGVLDPMTHGMAGLHPECLRWLHDREVAVLGSDGISDPMPGMGITDWPFPVHQVGITAIGLHLIDNMALGVLADRCATEGRWAFLLSFSPLRIPGGTGCPVNPVAVL